MVVQLTSTGNKPLEQIESVQSELCSQAGLQEKPVSLRRNLAYNDFFPSFSPWFVETS